MSTRYREQQQPVSGRWNADGEMESTGLGYEDLRFMQTERVTSWGKHSPAPSWVFNTDKLREVIARACEIRAQIYARPANLTQEQRIANAQRRLSARRPSLIRQLETAYAAYVELKRSGADTRKIQSRVEALDSQVMMIDRSAAIFAGVIFYSLRIGMNSPQVASMLGCSPVACRQILSRVRKIAERIERGEAHSHGKKAAQ